MSQTTFTASVAQQYSLAFVGDSTFSLLEDCSQPGMRVTSLRTLRPTRRSSCANLPMRPLSLSPIHLQLGNELARLRYRGLHSELLFFKAILLKSCVEG